MFLESKLTTISYTDMVPTKPLGNKFYMIQVHTNIAYLISYTLLRFVTKTVSEFKVERLD